MFAFLYDNDGRLTEHTLVQLYPLSTRVQLYPLSTGVQLLFYSSVSAPATHGVVSAWPLLLGGLL